DARQARAQRPAPGRAWAVRGGPWTDHAMPDHANRGAAPGGCARRPARRRGRRPGYLAWSLRSGYGTRLPSPIFRPSRIAARGPARGDDADGNRRGDPLPRPPEARGARYGPASRHARVDPLAG